MNMNEDNWAQEHGFGPCEERMICMHGLVRVELLDELALWSRALTADEMKSLYEALHGSG